MSTGIVVVGSANLDLVYRVQRIPQPGETLLATSSARNPGGKGNNQAIAAARAGGRVEFITALGTDAAADPILEALDAANVAVHARRVPRPTGTAIITVDDAAENTIVVDSGANAALVDLSRDERATIGGAGLLLLQLETPIETVTEAARVAHTVGTTVVLNAAPARELGSELLSNVDVLIVNEHEALIVAAGLVDAGALPAEVTAATAGEVGRVLTRVVASVVITLGAEGAVVVEGESAEHVAAFPVRAVDTTGAGDTLCGALVTALAEGMPLARATRFAAAAAALSVQREGAVPSIPERAEIDALRDAG